MIHGIGINSDESAIDGHLDRLEHDLARAQRTGFDAYELASEGCNVIRGGHLVQEELTRVRTILKRYSLRYTIHPPCTLRLSDGSAMHRQVFLSCLELTAELGASVMVYHSGQMALRHANHDVAALPDAAALQEMWRIETEQLNEMAGYAARYGVVIAVENRDPHLWELAALARHGKGASDLITYHQGMRLDLLVQQVAAVASPNVGICLDVGHAFLAAPYWPDPDYLAAVRQAAPWIKHVHFHDNFGRLDDRAESMRERLVFGEADNHMPPGWGAIPLAQVASILRDADYAGCVLVEVDARYMDMLPDALAATRAIFGHV